MTDEVVSTGKTNMKRFVILFLSVLIVSAHAAASDFMSKTFEVRNWKCRIPADTDQLSLELFSPAGEESLGQESVIEDETTGCAEGLNTEELTKEPGVPEQEMEELNPAIQGAEEAAVDDPAARELVEESISEDLSIYDLDIEEDPYMFDLETEEIVAEEEQ